MRILITNDDGIEAEGIRILVEWAKTVGEVTVVAPKFEQSAKSHAINIHTPFEVTKRDIFGEDVEAYAVDSTPADCVRMAVCGFNKEFDVIFSGINKGVNMGDDILYSATCGALFEAGFLGINGIAFSTFWQSFECAKAKLGETFEFIMNNKLFDYNNIYNVNFPASSKGIRITKQGDHYYQDRYIDLGDGTYQAKGYCVHDNKHLDYVDTDATTDGYISITPMTVKRTNYEAFEKLKGLNG